MHDEHLGQSREIESIRAASIDLHEGVVPAQQTAQARGNMYRFLAAVYLRPPQQNLLRQLTEDAFLEELSSLFSAEAIQSLKELAAASDLERVLPFLRQDYMNLFAVPTSHYVTPFEDVYRNASPESEQGLGPLLGLAAIAVTRIYREAGAKMDRECRELPTHIGVELSFMGFLCEREVMALRDEQGDSSLNSGGGNALGSARFRNFQVRFLQEHLNRWFPQLSRSIQNYAQSQLYRGLALVTEEFLARDAAGLEVGSDSKRSPG